jgi:hypothetical protein
MEQTIGEALALERDHLLPLPARQFPCCVLRPARANGFGLVTFQTNRYSVPAAHAHEKLWLRAFVDRVEISNGRQVVAVHPRCYQREQDILDPLHYLPLLEQRPGAWDQAKPIQEWQQQWPRVYERYLDALRERLSRSQAIREFVHVLQLHTDYPEQTIAQALEEALTGHCYSADGVKQLVLRLIEPPRLRTPLEEAQGLFPDVRPVAWPEVSQFDRLLSQTRGGQ